MKSFKAEKALSKQLSKMRDDGDEENDQLIFKSLLDSRSQSPETVLFPGLPLFTTYTFSCYIMVIFTTVSLIEEKVVKIVKRDSNDSLKGPLTVFLETHGGLKVQTLEEAISDKENAKAFNGRSNIFITDAEREQVQRDETGLPINRRSPKRTQSFKITSITTVWRIWTSALGTPQPYTPCPNDA